MRLSCHCKFDPKAIIFTSAAALAPPRPRMGSVVDFCQMLEIQMGIHLRGGNIGVAEQFLDSANIAARLKQVTGK